SGISQIWLGASKMGRPVYKKFGFMETDEFLELGCFCPSTEKGE
ncbi:GNAT family N-acetyltransferase, partial [Bacillus thuringiensis]